MLCKNPRCRALLGTHHWGDGYCSARCWRECSEIGERPLLDPSEPTCWRDLALTAAHIDALMDAAAIDSRLPRIIYLRMRRMTFRQIGARCGMNASSCNRILTLATRNILSSCGL
jgi:hypothetical protein